VFGPKRDFVTGDWRKLHNEELHHLYSFPNIIRMIKSRMMGWAGHVTGMRRCDILTTYWLESVKEIDHP
jgi:hypothetical protein